ncbi:MAG: class I SAM-dependent methyltransferase [Lewinellaceae bacterium]|nr:class I SAM-dependent methyltransferase [Saprospiraceae bacterium]MCB9332380.1 class I SAM-dependent methyltransferase [Lewinellaceae bacterium]
MFLTKQEKTTLRATIFRHLDGIATAPTAYVLLEKGVLDYLLEKKKISIGALSAAFKANEGYLNVALRILSAQGWLDCNVDNEKNDVHYQTNANSAVAFELCALYKDVVELIRFSGRFHKRKFERAPFTVLEKIFKKYRENYGLSFSDDANTRRIQEQVLKHIEGMIIGPTVVALGMGGMFHKYFMEASFKPEEFHEDAESFGKILDFFTFLGWFENKNATYRFTEKGLFFARRASAYGVTVSYIPTFRNLDELIFGNPEILWDTPPGTPELHVDREMNVWGSGGAHASYFKKIDEIIIELFNRPLDEQPKGIVDMGCGNGAFLQHIFETIEQRTLRGEMLDEHPLFLVGADFNEAALRVTRANLTKADIWAKVIWGDIGRPDLLARDLRDDYGIELNDLLNVRTFLDHNRMWEEPDIDISDRLSSSTGAYAYRGKRLSNTAVEASLLMHFRRWAPYVKRFGLLIIELHTVPPALTAANLGMTASTAYDATHGFSDQYILEVDNFHRIAEEAGLFVDARFFHKFPDSELATVSINLLKEK